MPKIKGQPEFSTVRDLAEEFGVSTETVRRMVRRLRIKPKGFAKNWQIHRLDVTRLRNARADRARKAAAIL